MTIQAFKPVEHHTRTHVQLLESANQVSHTSVTVVRPIRRRRNSTLSGQRTRVVAESIVNENTVVGSRNTPSMNFIRVVQKKCKSVNFGQTHRCTLLSLITNAVITPEALARYVIISDIIERDVFRNRYFSSGFNTSYTLIIQKVGPDFFVTAYISIAIGTARHYDRTGTTYFTTVLILDHNGCINQSIVSEYV